jgi:hypothetical protein
MSEKSNLDLSDFDISGSLLSNPLEDVLPVEPVEEEEEEVASDETPTAEKDDPKVVEEEEEEVEPVNESTVNKEEEGEDLNLTPLFELINRDMPNEISLEGYDVSDEESLVAFVKEAVKQNSAPDFASEEVKRFNDYVSHGGDPKNYLDSVYGTVDYANLRIDGNEEAQKEVLRTFLKAEFPKRDQDWVEAKIERYENSGILEEEAKEALSSLASFKAEDDEYIIERQRLEHEERVKQYKQQLADLENKINSKEQILGKEVNKAERKKLFEFATVRDKYGKTQYERIMESAPEAHLGVLMLAYHNFDMGVFTKTAANKTMSTVKKNLSRYTATNAEGNAGGMREPKSSKTSLREEFGMA